MPEPKMLPPSLRSRKRYVVFEIVSEQPVKYEDLLDTIWSQMMNFLGELESAEAKMWLIQNLYDTTKQRGVIKCKHDYVEHIRAVLSLIQVVGETKSLIKILGVTGTIKSAKNKYLLTGLQKFTQI